MSVQDLAAAVILVAVVVAAVPLRPLAHRSTASDTARPRCRNRAPLQWTGLGGFAAVGQGRRSDRPGARDVAAWCDDIARRVRSGSSLRDAVGVLPDDTSTTRATAMLRLSLERGASIADAVDRVGDVGPHLRLALGVIATTSRIGGPSAASIDRTAVLLRQRAADLDERTSQASQARLSSHVMTAVPLLTLALLVSTDADVRSVSTSPVGAGCIGAGLVMNLLGWWWMHRIVGPAS